MKNRILLVEDDDTLSMIIVETLQRNGFEVQTAQDGESGILKYSRTKPDIIIADVMMPKMDGFEMARRIRTIDREIPLIFLTAKSEIDDIVTGFELGANDYLKKPFKMMELIVRIKAHLRRNLDTEKNRFRIGDYILQMDTQTLSHPHRNIELTSIEARLLRELIVNKGRTVEASALMILLWQRDDIYSRNSLHGFIHKLRQYLNSDSRITIINQRGIGYMLTETTI